MIRFLHSSDWQIGKTFAFADEAAQSLRDERLDAITRLGALAVREGAAHVLVAGDLYDVESPSARTLRQPMERMRAFPTLRWHVIPGNHDPHTASGPWERLRVMAQAGDVPENVRLHLAETPVAIDGAYLLPAVLTRRHAIGDPTGWMDEAVTPAGAVRIGLAHGSIAQFGSDPGSTKNRIAPDRARRAGLDYLALGDWHGPTIVDARTAYSGTPEIDDFGVRDGGQALLVELAGVGAAPLVTQHKIGRFDWRKLEISLHEASDIDVLESRLRGMSAELGSVLLWLSVSGALPLAARAQFERRIVDGVGSALRVLRVDDETLRALPTAEDLAAIDHAGFVRSAADRLATLAADEGNPKREIAAAALQRLYVLTLQCS